ncbi:amino acid ABC transporter substrate-binding protein/permease [Levilactobacillus spicheri]|uniref:Glutamine ABC transporter substrate-binding protein n=2 Tax=Levilactobacillus spicheri TaxID=216463 RepID=A0ABQ0WRQ0_9LACO|nr:amino acid ABC transporter substrate-binding protein/permease [Levilactobacillus spicheri]KRL50579.1 glutamine abc transporter, substrate binding and permease protein [Levilactobacillus spicheri DSM 15429]GEO67370.1 glutamine ABC transporter substrate-binding protein [Levilactobacillus spicheri]
MKKWQVLVITLLVTLGSWLGLATTAHADADYTIATDTTFPPFEFQVKGGQYKGIDIDLLRAIAKKEHFTYQLKALSFNAAVQQLSANQVDGVIAGMNITPAREATFDFSKPYYTSGVVLAVAQGSHVKNFRDLKGQTVALKTGTAGAAYGKSIQGKYGFKIKYFNDSNTMYNDVKVGNSVACFEDYPVMSYGIKNGIPLKIISKQHNAGDYGFAVKKGKNAALLRKFNAGLAAIKADGTYQKIINKYLHAKESSITGETASSRTFWGLFTQNFGTISSGLWMTLELTVVAIILATLLGLLLGVLGVMPGKVGPAISSTIIYIFRGMPLMVLAFFIYIGIPNLIGHGFKIPAFVAGLITLMLNEGAYTGAFVKGGFQAVDAGQMEAARSLGLPYWPAMRKVIMPQGIRIMIPSFINQFIITLKDTSILSVIGIVELTQTGTLIIARNFEGFKIWLMIAMIYLIIITLLTWLSNWVQRRINA